MIRLSSARRLVAFSLFVASACSSAGSPSDPGVDLGADPEWRSFGHDLHNTRSNTVETAIGRSTVANLGLLWEHTGVETTSTPAVVDGVVYFADWDGRVFARAVADGAEVWSVDVSDTSISPSLAVTDDRVFVGDQKGSFYALDRSNGDVVWSKPIDDHPDADILSSAVPVDDIVIVGVASSELTQLKEDYTFRGSIVALAQEDGAERWRAYVTEDDETSGAGVSVWSSAAIDTERKLAFIGTGQTYEEPASPMADAVVAVDYETGVVEWFRQFTEDDIYTALMPLPQGPDADIGAAPNLFTIGGRDVVGVGDKGGVYAVLDRETGEDVWVTQLGPGTHLGGVMTAAAYHAGRIYVTQNNWPAGFDPDNLFFPVFEDPANTSDLIALDASNGNILWRVPVASPTLGGILYSNGVVYTTHSLGLLRAYDSSNGNVLWEDQAGPRAAAGQSISDGRLFVAHGFTFFAFEDRVNQPGYMGGLRVYSLGATTP
jgi:polyvinyl alcohol dehydrogenase (cytochrome)